MQGMLINWDNIPLAKHLEKNVGYPTPNRNGKRLSQMLCVDVGCIQVG